MNLPGPDAIIVGRPGSGVCRYIICIDIFTSIPPHRQEKCRSLKHHRAGRSARRYAICILDSRPAP